MKIYNLCLIGIISAVLLGCYPEGATYTDELDIVLTSYDEGFNFKSKSTYSIPDKIVIEVEIENNGDTTITYMKAKFADQILNEINDNMASYGWTKVDISQNPDMLLTPAGMSTTNYFYSYWYDWWYGGWYGWYYPPYVDVSSYTTGSFFMVLSDPNESGPIGTSEAAWISVGNGVLTYGNDVNRVLETVEQGFKQSTYLKIN